MQITAKELSLLLQGEIEGNPACVVSKLSKIEEADNDSLSFIANPKYEQFAEESHAGILVVSKDFSVKNKNGTTYIKVADPYASFATLLEKFSATQQRKIGIEEPSYIDNSVHYGKDFYCGAFSHIGRNAKIGDNVSIYPNCTIGDNCTIADNSTIYPNVTIYNNCEIGKNTIIHSGTVIGSDGFGFAPQADGSFSKVPQTGNVTIGNNVEIGANTVIDKATLGSTIIAEGVKIDNLVQIAHNVEIDKHSVIAAQAGISGSTKLGKHVMVGGQVGFVGHIKIADGVKINAQSGVSKTITQMGKAISGSPAEPFRQHYKNIALQRQLPDLLKRIKNLENQLNK